MTFFGENILSLDCHRRGLENFFYQNGKKFKKKKTRNTLKCPKIMFFENDFFWQNFKSRLPGTL